MNYSKSPNKTNLLYDYASEFYDIHTPRQTIGKQRLIPLFQDFDLNNMLKLFYFDSICNIFCFDYVQFNYIVTKPQKKIGGNRIHELVFIICVLCAFNLQYLFQQRPYKLGLVFWFSDFGLGYIDCSRKAHSGYTWHYLDNECAAAFSFLMVFTSKQFSLFL